MTAGEVVLGRKNLYMLPTRQGLVFSLLLLVLLLGSVNYGNGLAYALTFLLAGHALVSMLYTHANLAGLRATPGPCAPVFAGDPAHFAVCLHNDKPEARLGVVVEHERHAVATVDVPGKDSICVDLVVMSRRRGYLACPPVVIATRYPLGLLRSWSRRLALARRCLVYPRPGPARPLPKSGTEGEERAVVVLDGDEFLGLRAFRTGDPPQHIDWKSYARGRGLLVKEFGAQEGEIVWLDWDQVPERDVESRLSQLCRWVLDADQMQREYGLRLPDQVLAPARGIAHRARCLEALALFKA
jgi:uncharacterized protein (DUF58 family)